MCGVFVVRVTQCLPLCQCLQSKNARLVSRYGHPKLYYNQATMQPGARRAFYLPDNSRVASSVRSFVRNRGAGCYMLYCYTTDVIIVIILRVTTGVTSTHWLGDMMECVRLVMGALITWHYSPGHLVSSWSQHPPRNIIMPSLPYQHTTSHKLCKETRASKNSARMLSKYETFKT